MYLYPGYYVSGPLVKTENKVYNHDKILTQSSKSDTKQKKGLQSLMAGGFSWRRGWDSNPRGIAPKLISSQPRYDHFDTSPDNGGDEGI